MIKLPKFLRSSRLLAVICISLLIHLLIGVFYGGYVIFEKYNPPEPELVAPPIPQGIEPRKKEYKIKMEKSQKQSSAPLPIPIVANLQSDLSLEDIDLNVSSPRSDQRVRGVGSGEGVGKGFGDGFGSGAGFGIDINIDMDIDFFGVKGGGQHVAFVIDYSQSMNGDKEIVLRREAMRVFEELPEGLDFAVIFFAGPAWAADKDPQRDVGNWVRSADSAYGSYRPKKMSKLPRIRYETSSRSMRNRYKRIAEKTPLVLGTVFDVPIYMAMTLDPIPDTIFFMTDGACSKERGLNQIEKMVAQLKAAGKPVPVIHTVGLGIERSPHLEAIARLTGGQASFLTTAQYIKKYGTSRVKIPGKGPNVHKQVKLVDVDKYPVIFDLSTESAR